MPQELPKKIPKRLRPKKGPWLPYKGGPALKQYEEDVRRGRAILAAEREAHRRMVAEHGLIVLKMKCRPKKETKHLYHKCEDGSGPVDLGVIVLKTPIGHFTQGLDRYERQDIVLYTVYLDGRIWDITVYDPSCVVEKYPPRMAKKKRKPKC